ncbi:DUF4097 family beta strand repeat-containing protein [Ureibacillus sinduriensis]|uniref:DUF4097 domain-containing protein n=1 Tax=Ureibacillus sinduriensis BLB-1 = JCM 15800 TaxID=1384057 RepID=A0A0A3IJV5_9BACL|nr:DUF4097 family beta strand repeat-containing protein [Ureibacillus sinduriensis]KGR75152.1 hypothetical protein CD33_12835 [Ureibacillus sinduriensis BLB-1 = JCM 15800]
MKKLMSLLLIFILGLVVFLFLRPGFEKVTLKEEKEIEIAKIEQLQLLTASADIEIIANAANIVKVELKGDIPKSMKDEYALNLVEEGSRLKISYLSNDNRLKWKFGSEKDVMLQVTLPEKVLKNLIVQTTSGDIVSKDISAQELDFRSTSGNQSIRGLKSNESLAIETVSGDITLKGSETNDFSIDSTSGNVAINSLVSQNGRIDIESGNINMLIEEMIHTMNIETISGDIRSTFERPPESLKIDFKGTSGQAVIKLKKFIYEDNAENKAVGETGDGANLLKVRTTSGDFIAN